MTGNVIGISFILTQELNESPFKGKAYLFAITFEITLQPLSTVMYTNASPFVVLLTKFMTRRNISKQNSTISSLSNLFT